MLNVKEFKTLTDTKSLYFTPKREDKHTKYRYPEFLTTTTTPPLGFDKFMINQKIKFLNAESGCIDVRVVACCLSYTVFVVWTFNLLAAKSDIGLLGSAYLTV